jgi:hypothetical protein
MRAKGADGGRGEMHLRRKVMEASSAHISQEGGIAVRGRLISALQEALDRDGPVYKAICNRHSSRAKEAFDILVQGDLGEHIGKAMRQEREFQNKPHRMIRSGNGAVNLTYFAPGTFVRVCDAAEP